MTKEEQDYWAKNNVETENVKYAVANNLMSAEDSGLSESKLSEKPLTVPEALKAVDIENDYASPELAKAAAVTAGVEDSKPEPAKITPKEPVTPPIV